MVKLNVLFVVGVFDSILLELSVRLVGNVLEVMV